MKTYLVGGAVRDMLLQHPFSERDWVVVGATAEAMIDAGFTQVGRDFPVFLHPTTKEEYALARTERKAGHGYHGFAVHADPSVTLEDDLLRRDLTINAMAQDETGAIIDPYGGRNDLHHRVLRHVSPAFVEDPLRVLRVARFAARYSSLGFTLAPETRELMGDIVAQGELTHLSIERVWVETERALRETSPQAFISVLRDCGALAALMPEVDALFGVPQRPQHHPEVDTGAHLLLVLAQAARLLRERQRINSAPVFAALTHDLGKATTPEELYPSHRGHDAAGIPLVAALCERLRAPKEHRLLALAVCEHHIHCHQGKELDPAIALELLEDSGALRDEARFEDFLLACEADARGRQGFAEQAYPQAAYWRIARSAVLAIKAAPLRDKGLRGAQIGEALRKERVACLTALRNPLSKSAGPT